MLACARFRDDTRFSHALGEQYLAHAVVDFVRAGVVQLLALEIDFRAAEFFGHTPGEIEGGRAAYIILEVVIKFLLERWVGLGLGVSFFDRQDERHQRFGDKASSIEAVMAGFIGAGAIGIGLGGCFLHG